MKLLSPFVLGSHQLRNRVVFLPFYTAYAEKDGSVSPLMLAHYSRMAAAGPGLVVVEASSISPRAASIRCLYVNQSTLPGLKKLALAIKNHGSRAVLQLVHTGRFNPADPAGPSPVPVFGRQPVREMDAKELKGIANDFAQAALIAKEAGFDGAELHGAQGYLLASFLSPRTNLREDEYGGTLEKRMAFPLEVAKAVRRAVGDWPIGYRFIAREYIENALSVKETQVFAARLAEVLKPSYLSVAAGTYECWAQVFPKDFKPLEMYMAPEAEAIKRAVPGVPVIAAGHMQSPADCEALLERGGADMIGLARVLFADADWIRKAEGVVKEPIRPCVQCGNCMKQIASAKPAFCAKWSVEERLQRLNPPSISL